MTIIIDFSDGNLLFLDFEGPKENRDSFGRVFFTRKQD